MHGRFYAIDQDTGEPAWQLMVEDNPDHFAYGFASSPAIWNEWVFVGGLDGKMYGLKAK
jgi:outer membrane protein assembly factor BamB